MPTRSVSLAGMLINKRVNPARLPAQLAGQGDRLAHSRGTLPDPSSTASFA